ncbi:hypothetical protein V2632_16485, partial [Tenacibaculum maritimum]|uniref:hypothetical protein n=1 Tax=Tenacibaculum maritimum TaxID=107401 RepID=UPI00387667F4
SRGNETFLQGAGCFHGATKPSCKVQDTFMGATKPSCKVQGAFMGATKPSCKVQGAFTEQRNLPARYRTLSRSNETFLQGAGHFHGCNETLPLNT